MRRIVKTRARRTLFGLGLCIGLMACLGWLAMRPKIGHATAAEIEAVLPPAFREAQVDEAAVKRMDRVIQLSHIFSNANEYDFAREGTQSLDTSGPREGLHRELDELIQVATSPTRRLKLAKLVWAAHQPEFKELRSLLNAGGLQYRRVTDSDTKRGFVLEQRDFVRCLSTLGSTFASAGDFTTAGACLDLSHRLATAAYAAGGDTLNYLASIAMLSVSDLGIRQAARLSNCPKEFCRRWLDQFPQANADDPALASAHIEDFREIMLPMLVDPHKLAKNLAHLQTDEAAQAGAAPFEPASFETYEGYGTFDPILTARLLARRVGHDIECIRRPLDSYDGMTFMTGDPETADMPDYKGFGMKPGWKLDWERIKFRFQMSNTKNSLGRGLMQLVGPPDFLTMLTASCAWRARREETLVLLASVLYRRDHSGRLPATLAKLVPAYLLAVPMDPFTGKDMHYDPASQQIWCDGPIGESFDQDIISSIFDSKHVTVSLAISPVVDPKDVDIAPFTGPASSYTSSH